MKISQYFPKQYDPFGGDANVNVDLSNYVTRDTSMTETETKIKFLILVGLLKTQIIMLKPLK